MKSLVNVSVTAYGKNEWQLLSYETTEQLVAGDIVEVPFGKKKSLGVVIETDVTTHSDISIKSVITKLELIHPLPAYLLTLAQWMSRYWLASPQAVWRTILPSKPATKPRRSLKQKNHHKPKPLNQLSTIQRNAYHTIQANPASLLHGITGSGKTEIYLQLIQDALKDGKSSIVLVPEIMLTTQLQDRLEQHFTNVLMFHSGITVATRRKLWLECLEKSKRQPLVVIGARSALFVPLHNLGLIVIDEEHEPSYKQESAPRYDTVITAGEIARITGAKLVLGSATPSLRSYYLCKKDRLAYVPLNKRHNSTLPKTTIVDMRQQEQTLISTVLEEAVSRHLAQHKQVMLFLNKRGSARALICQDCGATTQCPHCHIALHYHADMGKLLCHYCGYSQAPSAVCTNCHNNNMRFVGDGTKKLEQLTHSLWPEANIARIDKDSVTPDLIQSIYRDMQDQKIDIIIGTQMINRGLDIANLTLVGIVDADAALQIPDFTASERCFQLISQAAGRAGRRDIVGEVIIQTHMPQNTIIISASEHNYDAFYQQEIQSREQLVYPPFCYLVKLQYVHTNPALAQKHANSLYAELQNVSGIKTLGPTTHSRRTLQRQTVVQIIIKSKSRKQLITLARQLPQGWYADFDPITLL